MEEKHPVDFPTEKKISVTDVALKCNWRGMCKFQIWLPLQISQNVHQNFVKSIYSWQQLYKLVVHLL